MMNSEQQKLAADNIRLVGAVVVREFPEQCKRGMKDEMMSIGYEGLCQAALCYAPDNGSKFSTYAYRVIKNSITTYFVKKHDKHVARSVDLEKVEFLLSDNPDYANECFERDVLQQALDVVERSFTSKDTKRYTVFKEMQNNLTPREISEKYGWNHRVVTETYSLIKRNIIKVGRGIANAKNWNPNR